MATRTIKVIKEKTLQKGKNVGKKYLAVLFTDGQWASAFDSALFPMLETAGVGGTVELELEPSGDFVNIVGPKPGEGAPVTAPAAPIPHAVNHPAAPVSNDQRPLRAAATQAAAAMSWNAQDPWAAFCSYYTKILQVIETGVMPE